MDRPIQLVGWNDINIKPEAMLALTSRSFKLYGYLVMKGQHADTTHPSIEEIVKELNGACGDEEWSEPTAKRCIQELVDKRYIYRQRRMKQSSITYLFKDPADCESFISRITHDPTVVSPMIRQSTTTVVEETKLQKLVKIHERAFGYSPLYYDVGVLGEMADEHEIDFLEAAYKEAVRMNKRTLAYVQSICTRCKNEGRWPGEGKEKEQSAEGDRSSIAGYTVLR